MFKVGLVGLGAVGFKYQHGKKAKNLTHFDAIQSNPNYQLICGIDPVKPDHWPKSISYANKINGIKTNCDIYVVSSPTNTHADVVHDLCNLRSSPKLILLEKPAGLSLSDVRKIKELSDHKRIPILVNFFRDCAMERIKETINTDEIKTVKINFTGTLLNVG